MKDNKINVAPYPQDLLPFIKRAVNGKNPFQKVTGKGKSFKDAGFKDVVIWETIKNTKYDKNDKMLLFTNDGDFNEDLLNEELEQTFQIVRTIEIIKKSFLRFYNINEEIFDAKKFVQTSAFKEQLLNKIDELFFIFKKHEKRKIVIDLSKISVKKGILEEEDTDYFDNPEDAIINSVMADNIKVILYYYHNERDTDMVYSMNIYCDIHNKEIGDIFYIGEEWDLDKGIIITHNE